eukprot:766966-Hanusia_phi.AAC.1
MTEFRNVSHSIIDGNHDEAMLKLREMLAKDPHNEDIVNNLAMAIAMHTEDLESAEQMLEDFIETHPNVSGRVVSNLATIILQTFNNDPERIDKAEKYFKMVSALSSR